MNVNGQILDFTSPGAIPPDPSDVIKRIMGKQRQPCKSLKHLLKRVSTRSGQLEITGDVLCGK